MGWSAEVSGETEKGGRKEGREEEGALALVRGGLGVGALALSPGERLGEQGGSECRPS